MLQDPNYKPNLGVPITSLWSHLYSITQSRKRGKARVLQKEVEVALVEYMKMMQAIKHLITFTQLHLKVKLHKKVRHFSRMEFQGGDG